MSQSSLSCSSRRLHASTCTPRVMCSDPEESSIKLEAGTRGSLSCSGFFLFNGLYVLPFFDLCLSHVLFRWRYVMNAQIYSYYWDLRLSWLGLRCHSAYIVCIDSFWSSWVVTNFTCSEEVRRAAYAGKVDVLIYLFIAHLKGRFVKRPLLYSLLVWFPFFIQIPVRVWLGFSSHRNWSYWLAVEHCPRPVFRTIVGFDSPLGVVQGVHPI